MTTKIVIALIIITCLKSTPGFASKKKQYLEIASESATTLVADFMKDHHDKVKRKVMASYPFGEDIDYAQLSLSQQEKLEEFISSQLILEAEQALPLSTGEIIAALMYVQYLEDLEENPYQEIYHSHGISDTQLKEASHLIRDHFHSLRLSIQENANVSRIPKKHQIDFLIHALGEEIINLLQTKMKIDLGAALEIYTYLQRLERLYALHKAEKIHRDQRDKVINSPAQKEEDLSLLLAGSFSKKDLPSSHLEKHWQTYAYITGGLGIAALVAYLKSE